MRKLFLLNIIYLFITSPSYSQPGQWAWATNPLESNPPSGVNYRVATDRWGNVYVGGYFISVTITFGSTTYQNTIGNEGGNNGFIVKYSNGGQVLWAHTAGGKMGDVRVTGTATDTFGNVYMTGFYSSASITFGNVTLKNTKSDTTSDIFIVKYDSTGNVIWAKNLGGNGDDNPENMTSDAAGNIYIAGNFYSTSLVVGPDTLVNYSNGNYDNAFVAKYDANGNPLWGATGGGDNYYSDAVGVAVSNSGSVYITGFFRSDTAYFGNDTLFNYGTDTTEDIVTVKYDANGNPVWVQQAGGTETDEPEAIAVSADGSIYITGFYYSLTCAFDTDTLANPSQYYYSFLAKYDSNGNAQWANSGTGNNGKIFGNDVTTDVNGNVYELGDFYADSLDISQSIFINHDTSGNTTDIFIAAYDTSGNPLWTTTLGGASYDQPYSLRFDNFRDLFVAGYFTRDTIAFGTHVLESDYETVYSIAFLAQLGCLDTPVISRSGNLLVSSPAASYQWYSSDSVLTGQTGQTFQPTQVGGYYVTGGDCGLASNSIYVDSVAGIQAMPGIISMAVYPNPANAQLFVQSNAFLQGDNVPAIFDITGRQIELPYTFEVGKFVFDTQVLPAGLYTVSINAGGQWISRKFAKTGEE